MPRALRFGCIRVVPLSNQLECERGNLTSTNDVVRVIGAVSVVEYINNTIKKLSSVVADVNASAHGKGFAVVASEVRKLAAQPGGGARDRRRGDQQREIGGKGRQAARRDGAQHQEGVGPGAGADRKPGHRRCDSRRHHSSNVRRSPY